MAEHSQFQLLREKRFAPFFWTQFLGAGNDNVYKNALVIFVVLSMEMSPPRKIWGYSTSRNCSSSAALIFAIAMFSLPSSRLAPLVTLS